MSGPIKRHAAVAVLALVLTAVNATKPLHIDDTAYAYRARHLASAPLDPYGGELFWYSEPQPAFEILVPPLLPYWLAPAVALGGDRPWLWKLTLLPFAWLLVAALDALLRRFVGRGSGFLLPLTALSPAFLPALNLMLDLPALALGLGAVAVFATTPESTRPYRRAALAGLLAGLAMQTKYTGVLAVGTMLLHGFFARQFRPALLAATLASALFIGWEVLMAHLYGNSHFLHHLSASPTTGRHLFLAPLVSLLGGVAPQLTLLGLAALRWGRHWVAVAGALVVAGLVLLACGEVRFTATIVPSPDLFGAGPRRAGVFLSDHLIHGAAGLAFVATLTAVAWRLARRWRRTEAFLVAWLLLEVAGYLALTPFPAARRVLGLVVVATLLLGRLAVRTNRHRPGLLWGVATFGVGLGCLYTVVDFHEARAEQQAVEATDATARTLGATTVWYVGHWGFQYHAERHGWLPVVPGQSVLRRGDYVALPPSPLEVRGVVQQEVDWSNTPLEPVAEVSVRYGLPWRTVISYYGGPLPLQHHAGPRLRVEVYRVLRDFTPRPAE